MKIEDLVKTDKEFINREELWDEDYQKMYGGKLIPPLAEFSSLVSKVLSVLLINGSRDEINQFEYGMWEQIADGAFFRRAVSVSARLSQDVRLETIEPYSGNLAFFGDLRIYFTNKRFFIRGKDSTITLSTDDFEFDGKTTSINNENELLNEIISRTLSKNVRIVFPWIKDKLLNHYPTKEPSTSSDRYDVFLSHKSQDYSIAKGIYDYLEANNYKTFLSEVCLPKLGSADYMKKIDEALDASQHMILVGSSVEHVLASWVEAEWRVFINEKRSGRKKGNFLTIVSNDINPSDLPISLRYYEVIPFDIDNFDRILPYLKE